MSSFRKRASPDTVGLTGGYSSIPKLWDAAVTNELAISVSTRMRSALLFVLIVQLLGCAGASEGKRRGWFDYGTRTSSCAADCQVWDDEREICLGFHEWTSRRCIELLTRGRR